MTIGFRYVRTLVFGIHWPSSINEFYCTTIELERDKARQVAHSIERATRQVHARCHSLCPQTCCPVETKKEKNYLNCYNFGMMY
jgi:hypothetical protein